MRWGLGLLMSMAMVAQVPGPPLPGKGPLPPRTPAVLWKALSVREPFLGSLEAREEPQSLYRFFGTEDYPKLRGNPALGFYDADGFRWVGRRVAWLGVRSASLNCEGIPGRYWDQAFQSIARGNHWKVDPSAPIRVKGACVGAVLTPSGQEPQIGVCLELQVTSPTGTLLYRYAIAQPSITEAVHQALEWTLSCARDLDQITPKGGKHGPAQP
jgi:hypothetical protein